MKKFLLILLVVILIIGGGFLYFHYNPNSSLSEKVSTMIGIQDQFAEGSQIMIYKTKGNYSDLVPIGLSTNKSKIVIFPSPNRATYNTNGQFSYPIKLSKGYLLDNRSIGPNTVFLKISYENYWKLKKIPSTQEFFNMIIDNDPFVELYDCGNKNDFENEIKEVKELSDIVVQNRLNEGCKTLIKGVESVEEIPGELVGPTDNKTDYFASIPDGRKLNACSERIGEIESLVSNISSQKGVIETTTVKDDCGGERVLYNKEEYLKSNSYDYDIKVTKNITSENDNYMVYSLVDANWDAPGMEYPIIVYNKQDQSNKLLTIRRRFPVIGSISNEGIVDITRNSYEGNDSFKGTFDLTTNSLIK